MMDAEVKAEFRLIQEMMKGHDERVARTNERIDYVLQRMDERDDMMGKRISAILEKMDKRDIVLFGEDGRGGLVADVNTAKARATLAMWIVATFVAPTIVGIAMIWASGRLG